MRTLVLLDSASDDMDTILRYITKSSGDIEAGLRFSDQLQQQCEKLASLPGMLGQACPEFGYGIRGFVFKGYIIFFRYLDDRLEVVNIIESHRDLAAYFDDGATLQ